MGSIVHTFELEQSVYAITPDCGLVAGVVKLIKITSQMVSGSPVTEIVYQINESTQGSTGLTAYFEADVFVDKATALAEYGTRVA